MQAEVCDKHLVGGLDMDQTGKKRDAKRGLAPFSLAVWRELGDQGTSTTQLSRSQVNSDFESDEI